MQICLFCLYDVFKHLSAFHFQLTVLSVYNYRSPLAPQHAEDIFHVVQNQCIKFYLSNYQTPHFKLNVISNYSSSFKYLVTLAFMISFIVDKETRHQCCLILSYFYYWEMCIFLFKDQCSIILFELLLLLEIMHFSVQRKVETYERY